MSALGYPISSTITCNRNRLNLGELHANHFPAVPPIAVDADCDHILLIVGRRHSARLAVQSRRTDNSHPNADLHAGIVGTRCRCFLTGGPTHRTRGPGYRESAQRADCLTAWGTESLAALSPAARGDAAGQRGTRVNIIILSLYGQLISLNNNVLVCYTS